MSFPHTEVDVRWATVAHRIPVPGCAPASRGAPTHGGSYVQSSNSPAFIPLIHAAISAWVNVSVPASRAFELRTRAPPSGATATSTQVPLSENVDTRQVGSVLF